jgi:hypothetical protein
MLINKISQSRFLGHVMQDKRIQNLGTTGNYFRKKRELNRKE